MFDNNSKHRYSLDKEIEYYAHSRSDRTALSYDHLDCYFHATVGTDFFIGKKVFDLGCGEGVFTAWIADKGKAESVIGLELTSHRIRTDYTRALPNLKFVCGDLFKLPIKERQFDIVFMNLVLHHVRFGLDAVIKTIESLLRPGGMFLAFEPNVYSPFAVIAHLYNDQSANEGFLSPRRVRKRLLDLGFTGIESGFFWRDRKWARNPLLATSFWVRGQVR